MEQYFCDNPDCRSHVKMKKNLVALGTREGKEVYRIKYTSGDSKKVLFLCSICQKSVDMLFDFMDMGEIISPRRED